MQAYLCNADVLKSLIEWHCHEDMEDPYMLCPVKMTKYMQQCLCRPCVSSPIHYRLYVKMLGKSQRGHCGDSNCHSRLPDGQGAAKLKILRKYYLCTVVTHPDKWWVSEMAGCSCITAGLDMMTLVARHFERTMHTVSHDEDFEDSIWGRHTYSINKWKKPQGTVPKRVQGL